MWAGYSLSDMSLCAQARWEYLSGSNWWWGEKGSGRRAPARSGLDCAEAELDVIYTLPTSGSSGRRSNHYLPPENCPSHVAVGVSFHIKMYPLLLPHLSLAPTSDWRSLPILNSEEKKRRDWEWAGDDDQKKHGMGGSDGCRYFVSKH